MEPKDGLVQGPVDPKEVVAPKKVQEDDPFLDDWVKLLLEVHYETTHRSEDS